jgi:excinuclease UvrABC ATPase subunit
VLKELRDLEHSLVVEHEEEIIRAADHIIDMVRLPQSMGAR